MRQPAPETATPLRWAVDVPLRRGATHEWMDAASDRRDWRPPLTVLAAVASEGVDASLFRRVVWIGRRVFPYPLFLSAHVRAASVFLDPPNTDARFWAMDLVLRSAVPVCVVADGQGMTAAVSRRLQLAAGCGQGIGLFARPGVEGRVLSAATTRWRVESARRADAVSVAWKVTLLRNKDQPMLAEEPRAWLLESGHASSLVVVPPVVASRTDRTPVQAAAS